MNPARSLAVVTLWLGLDFGAVFAADVAPPAVPGGLVANAVTTTGFTLKWTASTDNVKVTGYDVQRDATVLGAVTTTSLAVAGLTPATNYAMTVRARDAAGNVSAWSSPLAVTTRKANQTAPAITSPVSATYGNLYSATATGGAGAGNLIWALGTGSTAAGAAIDPVSGVITANTSGKVGIKVQRTGDATYNPSPFSANFLVMFTTRPITVTLGGTKAYDGTTASTETAAAITAGTLAPGDSVAFTYAPASSAKPGSYLKLATPVISNATAPATRTTSYAITYAGAYVITKAAQPAPAITSSTTATYGTTYKASATGGPGTGALVWALGAGSTASGAAINANSRVITALSTGTVVINVQRAADANYDASPASTDFTVTVAPRPITVTLRGSKVYDGTTAPTGAKAARTTGTLATGDTIRFAFAPTSSPDAGAYPGLAGVTIANPAAPTDRTGSYALTYAGNFTVIQAAQTAVTITSSHTTTYGTPYTATASGGLGTGAYVWALGAGSTAAGAAIDPVTGSVTANSKGTVVIRAFRAGDIDYKASAITANFTVTFAVRPITVTLGGSKPWDGTTAPTGATASITTGSLGEGDAIAFAFAPTSSAPVGSYSGITTAMIANAAAPLVRTTNYVITYAGTYTIGLIPATFALSATSFTFNGTAQGPSVVAAPSGATFTTGGTLSATAVGTYTATATAIGNYSGTNPSLIWQIVPANTPPPPPTGLASSYVTANGFTLNWDAGGSGVTGYEVVVNGVSQGPTTVPTLDLTGLNPGTSYISTVRSRDAGGNWSAPSPPITVMFDGVPFIANFEPDEGYVVGPLQGQNGWTVTGSANIVTTPGYAGLQALSIPPAAVASFTTRAFTGNTPQVTFIDLFALPAAAATPDAGVFLETEVIEVALTGSSGTGLIQVFDGNGAGGGTWLSAGTGPALDGSGSATAWDRYTVRTDYIAQKWDLYFNGLMIKSNLGFVHITSPALGALSLGGHTTATTGFDALFVSFDNPLFVDADKDGMSDAWETAHGLNPLVNDRNLDPDGDGLTNLQEYQHGTNPQVAEGSQIPATVSGLRLWLRADAGISLDGSGAVAAWRDQSGAHQSATQSLDALRPLLVRGVANSHPVVRFDGVDDYLDIPAFMTGATAGELFVIVKLPGFATRDDGLWTLGGADGTETEISGTRHVTEDFGRSYRTDIGVPVTPMSDYVIYNVSAASGSWSVRLNGQTQVALSDNTVQFGLNGSLGRALGKYLQGDIAEVIAYDRVLTPAERTAVAGDLNSRYAVVSAPDAPASLTATAISPTNVQLGWKQTGTTPAISYTVERKTGAAGTYTVVAATASGTAYTDTVPVSGVTYVYRVMVNFNFGNSAYSNEGTVTPPLDSDGDGVSDADEIANHTDPFDYYNGTAPILTLVSGDGQVGPTGGYLPKPLVFRVTRANGTALVNAPVIFAIASGNGSVAASAKGATATAITLRADAQGMVQVYQQTSASGANDVIQARADTASASPVYSVADPIAPVNYTAIPLLPADGSSSANLLPRKVTENGRVLLTDESLDPIEYGYADGQGVFHPLAAYVLPPAPGYRWVDGVMEPILQPFWQPPTVVDLIDSDGLYGRFHMAAEIGFTDINDSGDVVGYAGTDIGTSDTDVCFDQPAIWPVHQAGLKLDIGTANKNYRQNGNLMINQHNSPGYQDRAVFEVKAIGDNGRILAQYYDGGIYFPEIGNPPKAQHQGTYAWASRLSSAVFLENDLALAASPDGSQLLHTTQNPVPYSWSYFDSGAPSGRSSLPLYNYSTPIYQLNGTTIPSAVNGPVNNHGRYLSGTGWAEAGAAIQLIPALAGGAALAINDRNDILGRKANGTYGLWVWQGFNTGPASGYYTEITKQYNLPTGWQLKDLTPSVNNSRILVGRMQHTLDANGESIPANQQAVEPVLLVPAGVVADVSHIGVIRPDNVSSQPSTNAPVFLPTNDLVANRAAVTADDLPYLIPVGLDIHHLLINLPVGSGYTYKLKQADGAVKFIYTSLTLATAVNFRDGDQSTGYGPALAQPLVGATAGLITADGTPLTSVPFLNLVKAQGAGVILLESPQAVVAPLTVEVADATGKVIKDLPVPLLAVQAELAVDANRDGQIKLHSEDATDTTSSTQPYRFWLNDDNDRNKVYTYSDQLPGFFQAPASLIPGALAVQEQEQDDLAVSSPSDQNWSNSVIDCERDLEDFARLQISTAGLKDSLKNGQLSLGLKWTDVISGNPAIRLFNHAEADGGTKYLSDPTTAHQQIDQTGPAYGLALGPGLVEGSTPFVLPQSLFANLNESAPKTNLLFEGCKAGKGQLKLIILKPKGDGTYDTIGEGPGVWMELEEPHEFVERWSCGDGDRSDVQSVVRENANSASPAWSAPTTDEEQDYILYVHGYNMKEFEKQRWIETTFKRLYWLGFQGRVGGFTWPCSQSAPPFDESEEKSWQSATQLLNLLSSLKTAGYRVHVMAHSQGNVVTAEALRQWKAAGNTTALVSTYVASQAAIAAHCYASNVLLIPDFEDSLSDDHTPNVYLSYPPTSAPYLDTTAMQGVAGRYANFYNISDYALTGNSPTHPGWEVDQRWKPNQGFTYNGVDGFLELTASGFRTLTIPNDRFRIFCYGAEARSKALGTMPTGGVFTSSTNLQSSLSYGPEPIYHSGQFRSYYAARYQYWTVLLTNLGLQPLLP